MTTHWCVGPLGWRDPAALWWLFVGAPLLEEWVFRAGLQAWLLREPNASDGFRLSIDRHTRALGSVAVVALAFSVLHLPRGTLAAMLVFPAAVGLGVLYLRTRRWGWCALAHGVGNGLVWLVCRCGSG